MSLILHPSTEKRVVAYLQELPQTLLITGPYGIGASTLALEIARQLSRTVITVLPEKDEAIDLAKGVIGVGLIRRLYDQTRTKINRRIIVIDYAERMATAAQNTFLKLLEEPNAGTSFILVSHEPSKLLATIHSRVQQLDMLPVTAKQSQALLDSLNVTDNAKRTQLLYMAAGLPAELHRLVANQTYFDQSAQTVRDARELLQGNAYDKLLIVHKYKDNRPECLRLIEVAMNMLRQSLHTTPQPQTVKTIDNLLSTYDRIAANGNIRLQLAAAML